MAEAIIAQGGDSVTLPLVEESGQPVVARSVGKPNLNVQQTGALNPRHIDQWSGLEEFSVLGRFISDTAYEKAIALADLIKSNGNGNPLTVEFAGIEDLGGPLKVAPSPGGEQSLAISYPPGRRDHLDVDLGLTRVESAQGGSTQDATTPTATGSGPLELRLDGTAVELRRDLSVQRAVGRPNDTVRRNTGDLPIHYQKHRTAYDAFEIAFEFGPPNGLTDLETLLDLVQTRLGGRALTLDFNGLYGLGAFDVVPIGSVATRDVRRAAEQGSPIVPTLELRRVAGL